MIDVNGITVTSEDISDHVLNRIRTEAASRTTSMEASEEVTEQEEFVYMIPRSKQPAKDFSNPELLPGLYPTLFPYGCGVPEDSSRPTKVSLNQHIRYLLALEDRRFKKHHSFMFVLSSMIQRRQACLNASLMASRPYLQDIAPNLQTITSHEIEAALMAFIKNHSLLFQTLVSICCYSRSRLSAVTLWDQRIHARFYAPKSMLSFSIKGYRVYL